MANIHETREKLKSAAGATQALSQTHQLLKVGTFAGEYAEAVAQCKAFVLSVLQGQEKEAQRLTEELEREISDPKWSSVKPVEEMNPGMTA